MVPPATPSCLPRRNKMKAGPPEPRAKAEVPHCGTKEDQRSVVCRLVVSSLPGLFSHFFELLTEHLNVTGPATAGGRVEAVDGHVHPVMLFAFHNKLVRIGARVG